MIPEEFDKNFMIYQRDAVDFINLLHAESVQLIFTDPPVLGNPAEEKTYSHMEAVELCAAMADAATRALTDGGVLAISLARQNSDGVVAAVAKRTHLQFKGYYYDPLDTDSAIVVFYKGDQQFNEDSATGSQGGPLALIKGFVETHTDPGDIVVDPFCGNGDVMEAAVSLDRVAIMNDQDQRAVELTILRYKELSAD